MNKAIIFDFNRTIYDPEAEGLVMNAHDVLGQLTARGYTLFLVCKAEKSRENLLDSLDIRPYFKKITISEEKGEGDFAEILADPTIDRDVSFVIGDRIKKEITIGNKLGLKTIWFKNGKFAAEMPEHESEYPTHIVAELRDVLRIVP